MTAPVAMDGLPDALHEIVQDVVGSNATRLKRQGGGLSNLAFQVEAAGEAFVLRVGEGSNKLAGFEREQVAAKLAQRIGIPAQQIIAVGNHGFWAFTMALKVQGQSAKDVATHACVLEELGRLASKVHTIGTTGYGANFSAEQDPLPQYAASTWCEFLFDEWDANGRLQRLSDYNLLSRRQQSILAGTLAEVASWNAAPVLNHGDLRLKNVLVDDHGQITGLIDWETSTSSIGPHWDMSVALHDLSVDDKEAFLRGYGMTAREIHEWSDVWRMFNVLNYSKRVEHLVERGNWYGLDNVRTRLSGALDMYVRG